MENTQVDSSNDLSDQQIDSLLNSESPSANIPMKAETSTPAPTSQEYTLKVGGKEVKAPIDKVIQWAQMGYEYPQKTQAFKQEQEAFQRQRQELEGKWKDVEKRWSPYKEVDEYASKNPDWWQEVQSAYQQKLAGANSNSDVTRIKQELMQELAPLKEYMQTQVTKEQSQIAQTQDKQLSDDISSTRKSFPNIDFDAPDENGKSLEMKILNHAMEMGLDGNKPGAFRVAFRDFYHDHLISKAKEEGKELVSKEVQKRTKLGILGETSKPTQGLKVAQNVRDKSYNDLVREALDELKQAQ